jgi:hypothetical protein
MPAKAGSQAMISPNNFKTLDSRFRGDDCIPLSCPLASIRTNGIGQKKGPAAKNRQGLSFSLGLPFLIPITFRIFPETAVSFVGAPRQWRDFTPDFGPAQRAPTIIHSLLRNPQI